MVDGKLNFDTHISTKGFSKGLSTLGEQMQSLKNIAGKVGTAIAAAFSVTAVRTFAKECKSLYDVQLQAETKLETILRDHLGATEDQIKATKRYASELQEVGVIGDEVQLSGLQELSTYIENADSLKTMNRVLNDMLAQQYGFNATAESSVTIATMLGKVLEGQTAALSRYGYSFDEAQEKMLKFGTEEQRVATLAQVVESSVGGVNAALAKTPAGRMKQLSNTLGDIKEQFGAAVYQLEILFLPLLRRLADLLAQIATLAEMAAAAIANVFGEPVESINVVTVGGDDVSDYFTDLTDISEDAADDISDSLNGIGNAADETADSFGRLAGAAGGSMEALSENADSSGQLAADADQAADSYYDMAEAAEETQKANKGSLASFDKLNKLADKTEDNTVTVKAPVNTMSESPADTADAAGLEKTASGIKKAADAVADTQPVVSKISNMLSESSPAAEKLEAFLKGLKGLIGTLLEPLKSSWDTYGQDVIDSAKAALNNIWELVKSVGRSFALVWTNGTGEEMLGYVFEIIKDINTFIGGLAGSFRKAWEKNGIGTDIVQHAADIFNVILGYAESIGKTWSEWAGKVDFSPALEAFDKLEKAVRPVIDDLGKWLEDINSDLLIPLASWTAETLIPAVLSAIADALDGLKAAWETAYPVLKEKLWDGFLLPLAKWAAEKTIELIGALGDGLKKLGESMTEEDVQVLIHLAETIAAITLACKGAALVNGLGTAIVKLARVIAPAFAEIGAVGAGAFLPAVAAAIAGWGIGTMIYDKFGEEIDSVLHPIFDKIVGACDVIAGGFRELVENTIPNIIDAIVSPFAAIGDKISELSGAVGEKMNSLADSIIMIWDSFGETITETIPGFFLETIPNAFSGMWENIKTGTDEFLISLGEVLVGAWEKVTGFFKSAGEAIDGVLHPIFDGITSFFTEKIPNFFGELPGRVTGALGSLADTLGEIFSGAWERIRSVFSPETASKHFSDIGTKIKTVFSKLGTSIKDAFKTAWSAVTSVFDLSNVRTLFSNVAVKAAEGFSRIISLIKEPVNGVIDVINFLIRAIASGFNAVTGTVEKLINGVADVVNKLSFDIPDWAGGGTLGFNMPHISISDISIPTLPRLATGTVVPANYGEFTAILGDNKREPEIVSPLSEMRKAVIQAMREMGFDGKQGGNDITIYIDGYELSYYVEQRGNTRKKRTGGA